MVYDDDICVNTTLLWTAVHNLLLHGKIDWLEVTMTKNNCSVPAFKISKHYKKYVIEPNLITYGVYDYDDYYGGVGIALFETKHIFELVDWLKAA